MPAIHDADVAWAARDSSAPARGKAETWVLHARSDWSAENLSLENDQVIQRLLAAFFSAAAIEPVLPNLCAPHRWQYAQATNPLTYGCLWDAQAKFGVCGDWCNGSRIEGAYLSGLAMADTPAFALHR